MSRLGSLSIRVQKDDLDGGYVSEVIEVPGARSQGETVEEALRNAVDAALCVMGVQLMDSLANATPDPDGGNGTYRLALA